MPDNPERYRQLIEDAIGVFRTSVREYIANTLNEAEGDDWYERFIESTIQKTNLSNAVHRLYQRRLDDARKGQREPVRDLEVDEFPWIVDAYAQSFELTLKTVVNELDRLRAVSNDARNRPNRLSPDAVSDMVRDCRAALTAIDAQSALGKLDDSLVEVVGALLDLRDPQYPVIAINAIFRQYQTSMRGYIRSTLQTGYEGNWFLDRVVPHVAKGKRTAMRRDYYDSGRDAETIYDVPDFPAIIKGNSTLFPTLLHDGTYGSLFKQINTDRIAYEGHKQYKPGTEPLPIDAERIGSACVTILTLCQYDDTKKAADTIRRHFQRDTGSRVEEAEHLVLDGPDGNLVTQQGGQAKVETTEQESDPATVSGGFEADPERPQRRPDESPRLEAAAATGQLGPGQHALADAGEARRIASSTQGGSSDGGGGSGAATLAGAGDEDRSPPVGEEGDLQKLGKPWYLPRHAAWIQMIVAGVALAIVIYLLITALPGGSPSAVAPAIDGIINCEPPSPRVGKAVDCTADLSGGEPDSWFWSVNGTPTSQSWSRGDPPYGDQPTFETTFSSSGSREITLTVENDADRVSKSRNIEVRPLPPTIGKPECSPATPKVGDQIRCTAPLGGGEPDSWTWSGGGDPESRSWNRDNPPYGDQPAFETTFSSPGSYELTLTVANDADDVSKSFNIKVLPRRPTIKRLACSPENPAVYEPTVREPIICTAPLGGGAPNSWSWSGGDDPPSGDQAEFTTVFSSPGSREITLTVANETDEGSKTLEIEVLPLPPTIEKPECLPATPTVGQTVECTASLGGGTPDSWRWSGGGDPPSGDKAEFTTVFSSSGPREITLTVENAGGGSSAVVEVQVREPLPPPSPVIDHIICEPASPVVGKAVSCSAELSGGTPDSWSWSVGDDSPTGWQRSFTTVAHSAGELTITLTVENAGGDHTDSLQLQVLPEPCLSLEGPDGDCLSTSTERDSGGMEDEDGRTQPANGPDVVSTDPDGVGMEEGDDDGQ